MKACCKESAGPVTAQIPAENFHGASPASRKPFLPPQPAHRICFEWISNLRFCAKKRFHRNPTKHTQSVGTPPGGFPFWERFFRNTIRKLSISRENPTQPSEGTILFFFVPSYCSLLFCACLVPSVLCWAHAQQLKPNRQTNF